jgi:uncharacterized protein
MSEELPAAGTTEIADGMRIDRDVPIPMDDGIVLRADVFRPIEAGRFPVLITYGPYGKNLSFQKGYPEQWQALVRDHPDAVAGSTNNYQCWETVDPEKWVPDGYAVVRVDSRGAGCSPGVLNVLSPRETQDFYECIEWAARQPWSSGKVGLLGISYYAINQWMVAGLKPPHLAAMLPWEGAGDHYRDWLYHGGIFCEFGRLWYRRQVAPLKHGLSKDPTTDPSGTPAPEFSGEDPASNPYRRSRAHPLVDAWHGGRSADWSKVTTPFLSAASWGGQGLHSRGNFEGFVQAPSEQKWLEVHGLEHWTHFYTPYGLNLQKRFFGYFLKGEKNGWDRQPRVQLQIRHPGERYVERHENEWPLARTEWTRFYLDPDGKALSLEPAAREGTIEYETLGDGVTFSTPPLEKELEITGPVAAKLFVSSSTRDADLFLVLRVFDPAGREVVFAGSVAPKAPVAQGWLRASHRKLDPAQSLPYRPYHSHDSIEPLVPGKVYELEVEVWPTCIVVPDGYRLALTIRGKDYEYEGSAFKGCGFFTHNDPEDRPADVFGGKVSVHAGGETSSFLLLPIIPASSAKD